MASIDGYSKYDIQESGKVIGPRGHALSSSTTSDGYELIPLYSDEGKQKTFSLHRLVALAFVPNPKGKAQVNHINGDKSDNRASNLEWSTRSENMAHAVKHGLIPCKVTTSGKLMIKELVEAGMAKKLIAQLMGVSRSYINKILSGRAVTHA
jgi:hypothetical protein